MPQLILVCFFWKHHLLIECPGVDLKTETGVYMYMTGLGKPRKVFEQSSKCENDDAESPFAR